MQSRNFAFRAHEEPEGQELSDLYGDLGEGAALTPFQDRDFLAAFYRKLPDDCSPLMVGVTEAGTGRTAMLLPLLRREADGYSYIEMADLGVSDYVAPLVAGWFEPGPAEMEAIWRGVKPIFGKADILTFKKIPACLGSGRTNPLALLPGSVPMGISTRIFDLSDRDNPLHYSRSGIYKDGLRQFRKLAQRGAVTFRLANTRQEALEIFGHLVDQRVERFAELGRRELLADPAMRGFYRDIVAEGVPAGRVLLGGLYLDGVCIATDMGLVHGDTHHGIMSSMSMGDLSRYSPGTVVFMLVLDATVARGIRYYDFGVGEFAYKNRLKGVERPLYERHEALSLRGRLALAELEMRRILRHGLARYPSLRPRAEAIRQKLGRFG